MESDFVWMGTWVLGWEAGRWIGGGGYRRVITINVYTVCLYLVDEWREGAALQLCLRSGALTRVQAPRSLALTRMQAVTSM